jgi:hemerythrin superfamily protein
MDATLALVAQHRAIETLFEETARESRRRARSCLVSRLAEELIAHLAAEETVFYPAVRRLLDQSPHAEGRACGEHGLLRAALRAVLESSVGASSFGERIAALRGLFEQHVRDEEADLFPRVVRAVTEDQRDALGSEILSSRPHVWIVTTEGKMPLNAGGEWGPRSGVSVLLSAASGTSRTAFAGRGGA